jgi:hypothetical protein
MNKHEEKIMNHPALRPTYEVTRDGVELELPASEMTLTELAEQVVLLELEAEELERVAALKKSRMSPSELKAEAAKMQRIADARRQQSEELERLVSSYEELS